MSIIEDFIIIIIIINYVKYTITVNLIINVNFIINALVIIR